MNKRHNICVRIAGYGTSKILEVEDSDRVCDMLTLLPCPDCYVLNQGKVIEYGAVVEPGEIYTVCPRLRGGKGGFGSMLRAIGAQIEKTTNREACRDLSGRRMRDVNNEKKMVEFIEKKAEQERERARKKMEKLEHLTQDPKHFFNDPEYDAKVHEAVENVDKAVEKGIIAHTNKRKMKDTLKSEPKLKKGLWLEEDELSSGDSDSDSECELENQVLKSDGKPNDADKVNADGACSSNAEEKLVTSGSETKDSSGRDEADANVNSPSTSHSPTVSC